MRQIFKMPFGIGGEQLGNIRKDTGSLGNLGLQVSEGTNCHYSKMT